MITIYGTLKNLGWGGEEEMDQVCVHCGLDSRFPGPGIRNFPGMTSLSRAANHHSEADQEFQVRYWFKQPHPKF